MHYAEEVYSGDLHAKRVQSLAGATLDVMQSASFAAAVIGKALALARDLVTKHAIEQVDRMLNNGGIDVWESFPRWVPYELALSLPAAPRRLLPRNGQVSTTTSKRRWHCTSSRTWPGGACG